MTALEAPCEAGLCYFQLGKVTIHVTLRVMRPGICWAEVVLGKESFVIVAFEVGQEAHCTPWFLRVPWLLAQHGHVSHLGHLYGRAKVHVHAEGRA
jgi:hypothetical protein